MYKKTSDLPEALREYLPEELQEIYLKAYQKSWEEYEDYKGGDLDREGVAHRDGMIAVQKEYVHDDNTGKWHHKDNLPEEEKDIEEIDELRKKIEGL